MTKNSDDWPNVGAKNQRLAAKTRLNLMPLTDRIETICEVLDEVSIRDFDGNSTALAAVERLVRYSSTLLIDVWQDDEHLDDLDEHRDTLYK